MTAAEQPTVHTKADANDATAHELMLFDTGQHGEFDAEELEAYVQEVTANDSKSHLVVTFHEIHRTDEADDGEQEQVMSTLRHFSLHLAVQNDAGDLQFHLDGTRLVASLLYDDGKPVEVQSATHEPALLASGGQSPPTTVIEGGVATLRLRITVLSSLCNKHQFIVQVAAPDRPELMTATTAPVKTITKLFRTPRDTSARRALAAAPLLTPPAALVERNAAPNTPATLRAAAGAKRALAVLGDELTCSFAELSKCTGDAGAGALDCGAAFGAAPPAESLDELWEHVAQNGAKLLELQAQQRRLFKELRLLKQADGVA